ncbi:MAG: hypothetical protein WD928_12065 [Gammaproteobacteria bacterium]
MTVRTFAVMALAAVLAACGNVTFKRGADPTAMAADERSCRTSAPDDAGFAACMRERGWFVALSGEDAATSKAADRWLEAHHDEKPAAVMSQAVTVAPGPAPAADVASPSSDDDASTPAPAPVATAAKPAFDPLAEATVASWWKLGGSAAALDAAIADCVVDLGVAHRPDPGARRVTAGLRACLRAEGWFAVGN